MKLALFLKNTLLSIYSSIKRFPIPVSFSTLTTIILIILTHEVSYIDKTTHDTLSRLAMVTALGIPLSLCINLLLERKFQTKFNSKIIFYVSGAIALIIYYLFLLKDFSLVPTTRYFGLSLALYLLFICIPYYYKKEGFELYVIKLLSRFFVTILYSGVLYLGISAILFTINKLLLIDISGKIYVDVAIVVIGVIAVCFFLAGIPLKNQELNESEYPKLLKILLLYIVMPLISVYTVILYIYFAKIVVTLQWPLQLVMHLVLWYSVISIGVIFLTSILSYQNKWIKGFTFWFTKLIFPLILMMFVSIGLRVKSYGITENRYYVIVLGLWVLCITLYINFSKKRRNIVLPLALVLIALISVFGPLSSYSISKFSQNKRLERILSKYDMLKNNEIVKPKSVVSKNDKIQISQILYYFSNSHKLSDIKHIPQNFKLSDTEGTFGFSIENTPNNYNSNNYFSFNTTSPVSPIDISGYNYFVDMRDNQATNNTANNKFSIEYDSQSTIVKIHYNGNEIYNNTLSNFSKKLIKNIGLESKQITNPNDMIFNDENPKIKVKFVFLNINGHNDSQTGEPKMDYMSFYMLVKIK